MAIATDKQVIYEKIRQYTDVPSKKIMSKYGGCIFSALTAKGTFDSDSDIDLAVFLDRDDIEGFKEQVELMRLRWDIDLSIEPHAFARTDFDETDPFINEIIRTGNG